MCRRPCGGWPMWLLCQPKSFCSWLWDFGLWDFGLGLDNNYSLLNFVLLLLTGNIIFNIIILKAGYLWRLSVEIYLEPLWALSAADCDGILHTAVICVMIKTYSIRIIKRMAGWVAYSKGQGKERRVCQLMSLLLFISVKETIEEKFHCKIQDFYSADDREASEETHSAPNSWQNVLPLGLLILK